MKKRKKFKKVPKETLVSELSPLNISCQSTKCEDGLHCFTVHQNSAKKKFGKTRVCYECGKSLKDWDKIHKKDINDVKYVFDELQNELIRHVYFHIPIEEKDLNEAIKKGYDAIEKETIDRITNVIGIESPFRNGITSYTGNIIYYGQHATATCCRVCMECWHNIPKGRALTKKEIEYCTKLIMLYIKQKAPKIN